MSSVSEEASVTVDGAVTGSIGKGYLVLLGVGEGDTKADADRMVKKPGESPDLPR